MTGDRWRLQEEERVLDVRASFLESELTQLESIRRDAQAKRARGSWARYLVLLMLAALFLIPIAQHLCELMGWHQLTDATTALGARFEALTSATKGIAFLSLVVQGFGTLVGMVTSVFGGLVLSLLGLILQLIPGSDKVLPFVEGAILIASALLLLWSMPFFGHLSDAAQTRRATADIDQGIALIRTEATSKRDEIRVIRNERERLEAQEHERLEEYAATESQPHTDEDEPEPPVRRGKHARIQ